MDTRAVHLSGAPGSVAINGGAAVMLSVAIDEGEHTVATAAT